MRNSGNGNFFFLYMSFLIIYLHCCKECVQKTVGGLLVFLKQDNTRQGVSHSLLVSTNSDYVNEPAVGGAYKHHTGQGDEMKCRLNGKKM